MYESHCVESYYRSLGGVSAGDLNCLPHGDLRSCLLGYSKQALSLLSIKACMDLLGPQSFYHGIVAPVALHPISIESR